MKLRQNFLYLILLAVMTLLLFTSAGAQQYAAEKNLIQVGWAAGKFAPDTAGIRKAFDAAFKLKGPTNIPTVEFAPGVYQLDSTFIKLRDSVNVSFLGKVIIKGKHIKGIFSDDSIRVRSIWNGNPEMINSSDTSKKLVLLNGLSSVSYLAGSTGTPSWGSISGTLGDQSDLNAALNTKLNASDTADYYDKPMVDALISAIEAGSTSWGSITGTLSSQTDLQNALNLKADSTRSYSKAMSDALLTGKQNADADLTTYAGITPSANIQSLLGAADYSAIRTQLALTIGTNVQAYDPDLTTYSGITPSANIQTFLGSADFSAMRTNLGLVIGTNVQAYDADLTSYAGVTPSANTLSLLGAANYSSMRTLLGLVIGTNVQAYDADLTTWAGITPSTNVQTLLGSADYIAFKTSLSLNNVPNYSLQVLKDSVLKEPVIDGPMGTEALYSTPVNLGTLIANVDWKTSNMFYATVNDNREFNFLNTQEGQVITLDLSLTSTSWTITFTDTTVYWPEGAPPTAPDGVESVSFTFYRMNNKIKAAYVYYLPQE